MSTPSTSAAVVTGAGSGIGLATGRRLLREGFSVVGVDRDDAGLDRASAEGMTPLKADLGSTEDRDRVVQAAQASRYLVNAAGIIVLKPILEVTIADLENVYRVNVQAVWDLTARIGAAMSPGSAIVNLSSSSAKLASTTEAAAYASTKAAVLSLTRSFAYAFAEKDVRVNAVCPGIIDTPMQDAVLAKVAAARGMDVADLVAARNSTVPLKRAATADECAATIWFLLSPESSYMTGQAINVTGGLVMH
ncbi:MAG: SDR family oxidoreductase [Actinomycetales bacterium]|nr:SDR family oxidoreductase [Actinomycetales bacterium]